MQPRLVRWVLAHEPLDIFIRAAKKFSQEIAKTTNNQLQIEILTIGEYAKKYNNGVEITYSELVKDLNEGKLEMSQMYTHTLGQYSYDLRVLDLPFLFKDHDHAARVLDGEIGAELLDSIKNSPKSQNVKGMAFTYSGGFTVLTSNKEVNTIEDLQGEKVRVPYSPVVSDYLKELGMQPVRLELDELHDSLANNDIAGAEITYRRLYEAQGQDFCKTILHSNHNLFLTSIIINNDFWNSLSADLQKAVHDATLVAAQQERDESVSDDAVHRAKCVENGIVVKDMPEQLEQDFKVAAIKVHNKFQNRFIPGIVNKIKSA